MRRLLEVSAISTVLAATATAQFNNEWVSYQQEGARLGVAPLAVSSGNDEVDFAAADLDRDGWVDLVAVRKQPVSTAGKRPNMLFMNEFGTLVDRTALYATASDIGGDQGFLTPTNDRDVEIVDVDGDGWLDVVTAATYSDNDPKHIGHPRVYMNRGSDGSGNWLGLRHEDARIPQMLTAGGAPGQPSFCSVGSGDVDGDGDADLYFGDYDRASQWDYNDRLLINDGTGVFTDETFARMSSNMLDASFRMATEVVDLTMDGIGDLVADQQGLVQACYKSSTPGVFTIRDEPYSGAAYHVSTGDMNNDGRPDLLISDDSSDRVRYNLNTDAFGRAVFGAAMTFQFLSGGDDGFGGTNLVADLDRDGWNDALIADVDVDISGCGRRLHIYHNPGGAVGSQIQLREERQQSSGGWLGVKGMQQNDLTGTYDMAVFDINLDGYNDMVVGRCAGSYVWMNETPSGTDAPGSTGNVRGFVTVRR